MQVPAGRSRFAAIAVLVVVMLLGAEGIVRLRSSTLPPPQKWATPDLSRKEAQIDGRQDSGGASVVFLGSSAVDAAIDPSLLGNGPSERPMYNAGMRGGNSRMIESWAEHVAVPRLRPDVVVLGVISRELSGDDPVVEQRERDFFDAPAVKQLLGDESVLQKTERKIEGASALFKYRTLIRQDRFFRAMLGFKVTGIEFGDYISPQGQFKVFLHRTYGRADSLRAEMRSFRVGSVQRDALRRLLTFLDARVRHVVVVNMPVPEDYVSYHPRGRADYDVATRTLKREAGRIGATYIDEGIWPTRYFADPVHVNAEGSKRLTEIMGKVIAAGNGP